MTQHDDPLIQGICLSEWEEQMDSIAYTYGDNPPLRGIRVEVRDGEEWLWREYLPTDPFIGIHTSGPRAGARITMQDRGWSVETVREGI